MNNFEFKLNGRGVRELLKGPEMQAILKEHAITIKNRAGDGYGSDVYVGRNRANAMVIAESFKAKKSNLKHNTLLKAMFK